MIGRYQTARDFRVALEERLKQTARAQRLDLMRLRRQVAFDRLLARLFPVLADPATPATPDAPTSSSAPTGPSVPGIPWLLKGGYAFELRLGGKARATKDLDLTILDPRMLTVGTDASHGSRDTNAVVLERLREAVALSLGDGFEFRIGEPMADLDAAPYGGARYPVEARLDSRIFVTFHLDVGIGDATVAGPEWLTGPNVLGFAGIPPAYAAAISREQQFAEKIHAYTLPCGERTNTRVKDLVDLVLLLRLGLPATGTVKAAIRATFARRAIHPIPDVLEPPPGEWRASFDPLAAEVDLGATTVDAAFDELAVYWRTLAL
jgi:hypothetical protein